jgi:hypothetical protein
MDRAGNLLGGTLANINRGIDPTKLAKYKDELKWAADMIAKLGL